MIIFQYDNMTSNIGWYSHHLHSFTSSINVHHGIHLSSKLTHGIPSVTASPVCPRPFVLWFSEFSHQVDQIKPTQTMTSFRSAASHPPMDGSIGSSNHGPLGMWSGGWDQLDPVVTGLRWFHVLFHYTQCCRQRQASFFGDARVKQESNSSGFIKHGWKIHHL
jgi:hypothetical protein